jgi:hypothetical protein
MQRPRRRFALAAGLFLLAPLVGEFLLGNLPITWLWTLLTLAPLYGGGALLIREMVRRAGFGWPSMILLGLAYAVVEEAFVTESLFNPDYVGLRLLDYGYIPALGIGSWWTVFVLGLHTIWSTAVPIALAESLAGAARRTPWLGPIGLGVTALIFVAGCIVTAGFQGPGEFEASRSQLGGSAVVVVGVVVLAVMLGRRARARQSDKLSSRTATCAPLSAGVTALVAGSTFMCFAIVHEAIPAAANVTAMLLVLAVAASAIVRWSRADGWSARHQLAVAAGFMLTYVWYGFVQVPSVGETSPVADLVGNIVFSLGAIALLAVAWRRVVRDETPTAETNA